MIGGSSSINGLVYVRGNPLDFERWEEEGARGLGLSARAALLPARGDPRRRAATPGAAASGPLATRYGRLDNPLYRAFVEAARQAGYPATDDINGAQQEGFGRMDMTVKDGVRWSAANAYLKPALKRPNLVVRTARARHRDRLRGPARGRRALPPGRRGARGARAPRGRSSSGGPINSPQLLKLSGVGPAEELRALGIPVVRDLPGVGENLQDHLEFYFQVACTQPITLYSLVRARRQGGVIGARWLLRRDGLGATNHFESCGFIRSRPGIRYPGHPVPFPAARRDL